MKIVLIVTIILIYSVSADWQIETVDPVGNAGRFASLVLDLNDNPHISYNRNWSSYHYAYWNGSSWELETIEISLCTDNWGISICMNSTWDPYVACTAMSNGFRYAFKSGSDWQIEVQDIGFNCRSICMQLNSIDKPRVACTSTEGLIYGYLLGSTWCLEMIDFGAKELYTISMKLDQFMYPHISYCSSADDNLMYAVRNGASWQTEAVDTVGDAGHWSSLALDQSGYPHIAYSDSTNRDLKYAYWDGNSWQIETVDSTDAVGQWVSIDLDSSDYPHISYYDDTSDDLKYAYWDGDNWQIEIVDSDGSVGMYTSLELDSQGNPHIAYYDETNQDLKYAFGYETGIEGPGGSECYCLYQVCPNPSTGTITVKFSTMENAITGLYLYDAAGKLVRQFPGVAYSAGMHQVGIHGLKTGFYLCRMISDGFTATQRFVVIE